MNELEKIAYKANECSSFLHSAISSLTNHSSEIDHVDAYFERSKLEQANPDNIALVPLLVNVIDLSSKSASKVVNLLPKFINQDKWRFNNLLTHLKPFIHFGADSVDKVYIITQNGLVQGSYNSIVSSSQTAIQIPDWLRDQNSIDLYHALSTANHKIFTKRFNPELINNNPKYGSFYRPEQPSLVRKYIDEIRSQEPLRAQELEGLL